MLHANLALLALNVAHALDHAFNQGQGLASVGFIGGFGIAVSLFAVVLSAIGSGAAPAVTAVVGFGQTIAFTAIHVAPSWGPISDPYYDAANVNAASWAILAISLGISVYAGMAGVSEMRRRTPRTELDL